MSLGRSIKSNKPTMASTAASGVKKAATEPLLTGTLLYLLTRGSPRLRARLLAPFQSTLPVFTNTPAGAARLANLITLLKLLTAAGVLRRANQALNRLAWNNWSLGRNGAEWRFGPSRREVVLITGGSSGFGYEMVKAFARHARVVVIDVVSFPPELEALEGVHFYSGDLADTEALEALCERIKREQGTVSVLINNAGIGVGKTLLEVSLWGSGVGGCSLLLPSVVVVVAAFTCCYCFYLLLLLSKTFSYCFHLFILLSPFHIAFTFLCCFHVLFYFYFFILSSPVHFAFAFSFCFHLLLWLLPLLSLSHHVVTFTSHRPFHPLTPTPRPATPNPKSSCK